MALYLLIIANVVCVLICYTLAKRRNADSTYWALLGALIGPFAIPFVFFAKPRQS